MPSAKIHRRLLVACFLLFATSSASGQDFTKMQVTPADVFEYNFTRVLPVLLKVAEAEGIKVPAMTFPRTKRTLVHPADVYFRLFRLYSLLDERYDLRDIDRKPTEAVLPQDVFRLSQFIRSSITARFGPSRLPEELSDQYEKWKRQTGTVIPGDVHHLAWFMERIFARP